MKNKFKIVRRGPQWCVRVNAGRDIFDREMWPAHEIEEWLNEYGIPHISKKRPEYVEYTDFYGSWSVRNDWRRDYLFETKEDASWFLLQWGRDSSEHCTTEGS